MHGHGLLNVGRIVRNVWTQSVYITRLLSVLHHQIVHTLLYLPLGSQV